VNDQAAAVNDNVILACEMGIKWSGMYIRVFVQVLRHRHAHSVLCPCPFATPLPFATGLPLATGFVPLTGFLYVLM